MHTTHSSDDPRRRIADALAMMEAAGIIDFNGHFSARTGARSLPDQLWRIGT
jgi:hypothetical protein